MVVSVSEGESVSQALCDARSRYRRVTVSVPDVDHRKSVEVFGATEVEQQTAIHLAEVIRRDAVVGAKLGKGLRSSLSDSEEIAHSRALELIQTAYVRLDHRSEFVVQEHLNLLKSACHITVRGLPTRSAATYTYDLALTVRTRCGVSAKRPGPRWDQPTMSAANTLRARAGARRYRLSRLTRAWTSPPVLANLDRDK